MGSHSSNMRDYFHHSIIDLGSHYCQEQESATKHLAACWQPGPKNRAASSGDETGLVASSVSSRVGPATTRIEQAGSGKAGGRLGHRRRRRQIDLASFSFSREDNEPALGALCMLSRLASEETRPTTPRSAMPPTMTRWPPMLFPGRVQATELPGRALDSSSANERRWLL
jgi:hypothetical protein